MKSGRPMIDRKTLVTAALSAALLLASAPLCPAFDQGGPPPGGPPAARGPEMGETLQLYALHRMREALELSQEQTLNLMSLMEERRETEKEFRRRHREAMEELRQLVREDTASDHQYREAIQAFEAVEREVRRQQEEFREREAAILTPRQQAKRILFEPRFREHMRRRMEEIGRMHGGGRPPLMERIEQLRETNPELYEAIRERIEAGKRLTEEQRRQLMEERRKMMQERRPRGGYEAP